MKQFGTLDPFIWKTDVKDIDTNTIYKFPGFTFIVNRTVTAAVRVNFLTGAETSMTLNTFTWDIKGQTLNASRLSTTVVTGTLYYLKITIGGVDYYSGLIEGISTGCVETMGVTNSCNNFNFPFADSPSVINVHLPNVQRDVPETENTYETIVTENGNKEKLIKQVTRDKVWFVQPKWFGTEH